jgi:hypothetical protein
MSARETLLVKAQRAHMQRDPVHNPQASALDAWLTDPECRDALVDLLIEHGALEQVGVRHSTWTSTVTDSGDRQRLDEIERDIEWWRTHDAFRRFEYRPNDHFIWLVSELRKAWDERDALDEKETWGKR